MDKFERVCRIVLIIGISIFVISIFGLLYIKLYKEPSGNTEMQDIATFIFK